MLETFKKKMLFNIKRSLAVIIDVTAIALISGSLSVSPLNPHYEKTYELQTEFEELTNQYLEEVERIDEEDEEKLVELFEEYKETTINYTYEASRKSIYSQMISIACTFLYFALFAYYFDGQTVGKRLMKLKIVTVEGDKPSLKRMTLRTLITYGIPFSVLASILAFTIPKESFYIANVLLYYLTVVFALILIFSSFTNEDRRGLHDFLTKTKVVEDNKKEKE